jgi:hypothetical protein
MVKDVLLAGQTADGPALVSIEALVLDESGLTIVGPRPGAERLVPWSEVSGFTGATPASLPGGEPAAGLSLEVRGRVLRFLLPGSSVPPQSLSAVCNEIAAHLGVAPPPLPAELAAPPKPTPTTSHAAPPTAAPPTAAPPTPARPTPASPTPARPTPVPNAPTPAPRPPTPVRVPTQPASATPANGTTAVARGAAAAAPAAPVRPIPGLPDEVPQKTWRVQDPMLLAQVEVGRRRLGPLGKLRARRSSEVKPLLPADEFELASDPDLPKGGPAPGAVIEVRRHHKAARRTFTLVLVVLLALVAASAWYWHKHGTLPLIGNNTPPLNPVRDAGIAHGAVVVPADLPGWNASARPSTPVFAFGAAGSVRAQGVSANASGSMASCLGVSGSVLSAATGIAGSTVPDRTGTAFSPMFVNPADGSTVSSTAVVMSSSDDVRADAKVFSNASLFGTCFQPYVQSMLPFLGAVVGTAQHFDTATVDPMSLPDPPSGVRAYGFQITLLGHNGDNGTTLVIDAVAAFAGRVESTLAMTNSIVFPVGTQANLIHATEASLTSVSRR